jgi:predicted nucleic acid-binding protein
MTGRFLVDTDVLIAYLRGREPAIELLESLEGPLFVSAVTVAELYARVRDGEKEALEQFLRAFSPVAVDQALARKAGLWRRDYGPTHGTGLADAIIAASAEARGAFLVTSNRSPCPMVTDPLILEVPPG